MFRVESCNNAYRYCASNWKPFVQEARDYLLAMIPIVNLIFLQYRCHQAKKHIGSADVQENIRHFFKVMKACCGITLITAIAGIFHAIYCTQKRSVGIAGISPLLFASSTIAFSLLEYNQRQILKKIDAYNAALPAEWLSLLNPQCQLWISKMLRNCVSRNITVLDEAPSSPFVSADTILQMKSPIRLLFLKSRQHNQDKKNAGFSLMLRGTGDDHNAQALINIIFHKDFIREKGWRIYRHEYRDKDTKFVNFEHREANFFFAKHYGYQENTEPTEQIDALSAILQGGTYEFEGIHWQLDCAWRLDRL